MCKARPTSIYSLTAAFLCCVVAAVATRAQWATVALKFSADSKFQDVSCHWRLQDVDVIVPALHLKKTFALSELSSKQDGGGAAAVVKYSNMAYDLGLVSAIVSVIAAFLSGVSWFYPDYSGKFYYRLTGLACLVSGLSLIVGALLYFVHIDEEAGVMLKNVEELSGVSEKFLHGHAHLWMSFGFLMYISAFLVLLSVAFANFFVRLPVYSFANALDDTMTPMTDGNSWDESGMANC